MPDFNVWKKLKTIASNTSEASINMPPGSAPSSPVDGDVWGQSNGVWYRNGSTSQRVPRVTVTTTAPGSPADGDIWVDTSTPVWTAPTLLNSWVNFGSPYNNAGYMKDSLGFVVLRGIIKSGTLNAYAFTLPSGYRPTSGQHIFPQLSNNAIIRIDIDTSGNVIPAPYGTAGSNLYVALDGIRFPTF